MDSYLLIIFLIHYEVTLSVQIRKTSDNYGTRIGVIKETHSVCRRLEEKCAGCSSFREMCRLTYSSLFSLGGSWSKFS